MSIATAECVDTVFAHVCMRNETKLANGRASSDFMSEPCSDLAITRVMTSAKHSSRGNLTCINTVLPKSKHKRKKLKTTAPSSVGNSGRIVSRAFPHTMPAVLESSPAVASAGVGKLSVCCNVVNSENGRRGCKDWHAVEVVG